MASLPCKIGLNALSEVVNARPVSDIKPSGVMQSSLLPSLVPPAAS